MAASVDRRVNYNLGVTVDPNAKSVTKDFGESLSRAQQEATRIAAAEASKRHKTETDAINGMAADFRAMIAEMKAGQASLTSTMQKQATERNKTAEASAREEQQMADRVYKTRLKYRESDRRDAEKAARDQQKMADQVYKTRQRIAEAERKEAEKTAREEQRAADQIYKTRQRAADYERREAKEAERQSSRKVKAEEDAAKKVRREYEVSTAIVSASNKQMTDGALKALEGVNMLGQGLVTLGIVGEKDLEKLVRMFLRIKATTDIVKGGIEIYRGMSEWVSAYRTQVLAAAAAEEILAAARAKSALAGGVSAATGGGSIAAGAAGAAGGSGMLGGAIAGLSAAIFGLPGAIAAALGSVAVAGGLAAQSFNVGGTADKMAEDGWYDPNSTFGWAIAQRDAMSLTDSSGYETIEAQDHAMQSQATTQRRYKEEMRRRQQQAERDAAQSIELQNAYGSEDLARNLRSSRQSTIDGVQSLSPDVAMSRANFAAVEAKRRQDQLGRVRAGTVAGARQEFSGAEVGRAEDEAVRALEESVKLRREAFDVAKRTNEEDAKASQEAIRGLETRIEKQKQLQQQAEDRLLSARERFGQMSESEQQRAIAIKKKADAQGAGALSREERAVLRGVGTAGAEDFARQGDLASAKQAGFDTVFGGEERKRIAEATAEQAKLQVEVTAKREFIVKVQEDTEKMAGILADRMNAELDERDRILLEAFDRKNAEAGSNRRSTLTNMGPQ